jgi:hypothetical protein
MLTNHTMFQYKQMLRLPLSVLYAAEARDHSVYKSPFMSAMHK